MALEDSTFNTINVLDNEIIKANDFNFAFEKVVTNVSKAMQMILESEQDFVINGKVKTYQGMVVRVSPIFGVCKSTSTPFGRTETAILDVGFESSTQGRIDILEVQGDWETYDTQQRAFNDPDTDVQTYQYVDTKRLLQPVYKIKKGVEGGAIAPTVDEGWVKLAEVVIRANASSILSSDIKNITADIPDLDNEDWTTEPDITYNIGYVSDINKRFREQHNEDGTHKDNIVNTDILDIGVNTKQINGNVLPIGGSVSIPTENISSTDSITSVLIKAASMITTFYNSYLKYGAYKFKGEFSVSSLADNSNALQNPLTFIANGDGTATIKIANNTILSIDANGKISTNGYTPTSNNHLVTKALTDTLSTAISNINSTLSTYNLEFTNTKEYANDILSRYTVSSASLKAVATTNVSTSGLQTIDGVATSANDLVLLTNQTDSKYNGIWVVQTGAWNRSSSYDSASAYRYKLFYSANGTANKGKMYYCSSLLNEYSSNVTNLTIKESNISILNVVNKIPMRDSNGNIDANSSTATKLKTSRTIRTNLASTTVSNFDGSENITPGVSGTLPIGNGGTGGTTTAAAGANLNQSIYISTESGTLAKVGIMGSFKLVGGSIWHLYLSNSNTVANATLNINSTGAKGVRINGNAVTASNWTAGWYDCMYDGTYYQLKTTGTFNIPQAAKADVAVKLETKRDINISDADGSNTGTKIEFDGSDNGTIKLPSTIKATIDGNSSTATKLETARSIQTNLASTTAEQFDGSGDITPGVTGTLPISKGGTGGTTTATSRTNLGLPFVTCSTAASTAVKETGLTGQTLSAGYRIAVKFSNSNTATSPTLKINSTNYSIYRYGTTTPAGSSTNITWRAGEVVDFIYDGSAFQMLSANAVSMNLSGGTLYIRF